MSKLWDVANEIESISYRFSNIKDVLELIAMDTQDPASGATWAARDMIETLSSDLNQEVRVLWHKDRDLSDFKINDCIVLPGGFSYGDYLRCGAIARFSPMMQSVIDFASAGGKVLGVCNGFQILC
jgi:phosphoribosylformylglycinamidine (FGAM) synthase-like amidotransferase family enzyme